MDLGAHVLLCYLSLSLIHNFMFEKYKCTYSTGLIVSVVHVNGVHPALHSSAT